MPAPQVLVVDDLAIDRQLLVHHLKLDGYGVETANDGMEAWEMLSREPDRFCAALLDRSMPRMDGMELLSAIKMHDRLRTLPVIIQSGLSTREEMLEGIRAGAYYYLTKPYDVEMLHSVVKTAIDDYCRYRELQERVRKGVDTLRLLREAVFTFRTLEQAHGLGALLAHTCPDPAATVVGLTELLLNAIEHGNLGISYEQKSQLGSPSAWKEEVDRRLALPENASKEATVAFLRSDTEIRFVIRDQGSGFDCQQYLNFDPQRAFDTHGRGIAIANRLSFSSLEYRGCGNEVVATIALHTSN